MGIEIDNECLFTLQFADDQIIVANDKDDMQYMLRKLIEEYGEYLCIGTQEGNLNLDNGHEIIQCQEYEYMAITFDNTGTDGREIEKRIINAKKIIGCLNGILWSKSIIKRIKFNIHETMIKSNLLYGAETWRITERYKKRIEAVEMDVIRRLIGISRQQRIRNNTIKQQMGYRRYDNTGYREKSDLDEENEQDEDQEEEQQQQEDQTSKVLILI
ncbi:uncharacterized protein LOC115885465, partial [Sitophilus oryzae]|uniref:Uncharacterized protein LOC115885465 n=1 Tax=Sitophilus oryzae TaxID=7048 RepID=A0A6J2Y8T0_SITOR